MRNALRGNITKDDIKKKYLDYRHLNQKCKNLDRTNVTFSREWTYYLTMIVGDVLYVLDSDVLVRELQVVSEITANPDVTLIHHTYLYYHIIGRIACAVFPSLTRCLERYRVIDDKSRLFDKTD